MSMILAPLLIALAPPEETRPMTAAEMKGLRIWRDGVRGLVQSKVSGTMRERWMLAFKNETPFEIGSISVREVFLSGSERIYESPPVTITKFGNLNAPYGGSLLSLNKSTDNDDIEFDVPPRFAKMYTARTTEIVGATTFRHPNLHNPGHLYSKMQHTPTVDMIVMLKKDPSLLKVKTSEGMDMTLMAFGTSDVPVIQYVMDHGGNKKAKTVNGSTIMHLAAINGRAGVLDYALKLGGNVSTPTKSGRTPLIKAIITGQQEAWKWLLQHGAKPDYDGGKPGASPAFYAIVEGQELALAALVRAGAKPQALDKAGYGWMHYGVNNYMMLDALNRYHIPVEQAGKNGLTPLMLAAGTGAMESQVWFLQHGADPERTDVHHLSAFDYAKRAGIQSFPTLVQRFSRKR